MAPLLRNNLNEEKCEMLAVGASLLMMMMMIWKNSDQQSKLQKHTPYPTYKKRRFGRCVHFIFELHCNKPRGRCFIFHHVL